jgi:DNA-binding LytR/AlgR family response regulator
MNNSYIRLTVDEIMFIQAKGTHSRVQTKRGVFHLPINIRTVLERLNRPQFLRAHRSFAVNLNNVDSIGADEIVITGLRLPINKSARAKILNNIGYI